MDVDDFKLRVMNLVSTAVMCLEIKIALGVKQNYAVLSPFKPICLVS